MVEIDPSRYQTLSRNPKERCVTTMKYLAVLTKVRQANMNHFNLLNKLKKLPSWLANVNLSLNRGNGTPWSRFKSLSVAKNSILFTPILPALLS